LHTLSAFVITIIVRYSAVQYIVWHVAGDSCCNPLSLGAIQTLIEKHVEGIYVHSLQIGNNFAEVKSWNEWLW